MLHLSWELEKQQISTRWCMSIPEYRGNKYPWACTGVEIYQGVLTWVSWQSVEYGVKDYNSAQHNMCVKE